MNSYYTVPSPIKNINVIVDETFFHFFLDDAEFRHDISLEYTHFYTNDLSKHYFETKYFATLRGSDDEPLYIGSYLEVYNRGELKFNNEDISK